MRAYNEINYERRQNFFNKQGIRRRETYKKCYDKYKKEIGSATIQQVLNKNDEDWRSFFEQLKAKREDRLPLFIKKLNPPGYKKRDDKRELMMFIRKDQYEIYEIRSVFTDWGRLVICAYHIRAIFVLRVIRVG